MIFLTGGTGFIGKNFVEAFFAQDLFCKCLIRMGSVAVFELFIAELEIKYKKKNTCIEIVEGTLLDSERFKTSLCNVEVIIHCAAVVYARCIEVYRDTNVLSTEALVKFAKEYRIRKFVYLSSAAVLFSAKDAYAKSKRIAEEKVVEQLADTTIDYLILRPALVTGSYDNKNIAQIIQVMLRYRVALMVGLGEYAIQPLYVKDIVDVTRNFISQDVPICQAITLAPDDCLLYRDFLLEISKVIKQKTGKRTVIVSVPLPVVRWVVRSISYIYRHSNINLTTLERILHHTPLKNNRAKRLCGFVPTPISVGLALSVDFFVKKNRSLY